MKAQEELSGMVLSRRQWMTWVALTVTSLFLGVFGFFSSIQHPNTATEEFEDRSLIRQWGTTSAGTTGFYATVNTMPLVKYKDRFYVMAVCRTADPTVDSRSDNRIDRSRRFEIRGDIQTLQTQLSRATMQRLLPSGFVQVFVLLVPKAVEVSDIQTIGQAERMGARVLGVRAALVSTTAQR